MDRFDPFVKYADVYGDVINWEKDPMNKPQNQNKYFFSDGKTYYEQICKMLRLMSVFKQAFNQIYDNEDEIHSAWENFVDNLSATAVYGEEVGVNLTWTDTSVNFAFTIPGGQDGVGIQSITFNSDYTMTITLTDESTYTSTSLRGAQGEQGIQGVQGPAGPQGEPGSGLEILDVYATLQDLQTAHPTGSPGDAYQVGTAPSFTLYIWSASQSGWVSAGTIGSAVPSSADPLMDGTASAGISDLYSRGDHVHPTDTSRASAQDLQTVDDKVEAVDDKVDAVDDRVDDLNDFINTSQKLIDQSFVYRESPAEHDGLAVLDTIKGHTVKFNQLVKNGNFADTSEWATTRGTLTINNNVATFTPSETNAYFRQVLPIVSSHIYYVRFDALNSDCNCICFLTGNYPSYIYPCNVGKNVLYGTPNISDISFIDFRNGLNLNPISYKNVIVCDVTKIFGAGSEPATPEAFESWLSQNLGLLDYYAYTPGTLIPFKGTGLKTTGKNLFNYDDLEVGSIDNNTGLNLDNPNHRRLVNYIYTGTFKTFSISGVATGEYLRLFEYDINKNFINSTLFNNQTITVSSNCVYIRISGGATGYTTELQIEIGNVSSSFDPYTESTLDLSALNTLFPTGMKDAGSVYDEVTESKATTRLNKVVFNGSEAWGQGNPSQRFFLEGVITDFKDGSVGLATNGWEVVTNGVEIIYGNNKIWFQIAGSTYRINAYANTLGLANAQEFKTYLASHPLTVYYELATPIEQDIDLDLSFKAYEGGTEQLLPVNGSTPTTSSLLADMTYFSINDAMDYILAKLDQDVSSITSDITSLKTRMTSAEGNITSLGDRMTTAEGNITSLTGRMTTAEGNISSNASRISELETDLLKIEVKQFDYATVAAGSSVGTTTTITVEEGYTAIGVVGTEIQAGEFTSPLFNSAITQCHIEYTSSNNLRIIIGGRNNSAVDVTNVRLYAYILCMKDIQSE